MDNTDAAKLFNQLLGMAVDLCETAKIAYRNQKSLTGDNHYGQKFHKQVVTLSTQEAKLRPLLCGNGIESSDVSEYERHLKTLKLSKTTIAKRNEAIKALELIVGSVFKPKLEAVVASPIPQTEQVLPLLVIKKTRTYFEKIVIQANGCFEHQWFDACSVMIRRFVETLIIELYEAKKKEVEIKDANGDFLMLSKLIDKTLAETSWNLSRETKKTLPLVKSLGDRSAHNRRYVATKRDVDEVIPGLRVLADDLLHLAGLK